MHASCKEKILWLTHSVVKGTLLKKRELEKCNMGSVNLEKNLEYLKIRESLLSDNLTEYYLCKGISSPPRKILHKHKIK